MGPFPPRYKSLISVLFQLFRCYRNTMANASVFQIAVVAQPVDSPSRHPQTNGSLLHAHAAARCYFKKFADRHATSSLVRFCYAVDVADLSEKQFGFWRYCCLVA